MVPLETVEAMKRDLRARYDANRTTVENAAHWSMATHYDADTENSPSVREDIRKKARYESANNTWMTGMIRTQSNDIVGTGPRLQMKTKESSVNDLIETEFNKWMRAVKLPKKLRCMRRARTRDGEAFLLLIYNPMVKGPVKLDIKPIEADRVCNPFQEIDGADNIDGIHYDEYGNVTFYSIMKYHPGSNYAAFANTHDRIPAKYVIHLYDLDRPEQHRGISELVSGLADCATARRYEKAMVKRMETNASVTGVIESDLPPDNSQEGAADDASEEDVVNSTEAYTKIAVPRDSLLFLPKNHKMHALDSSTPNESQTDFIRNIKSDIGRGCMNEPKNVALGDSSGYNYSSGRMDFQVYDKGIRIEHQDLEDDCLDVIFDFWAEEFRLADRSGLSFPVDLPHVWFWDGREHVDPQKEANATDTGLKNGTETLARHYGKRGLDWEQELTQSMIEEKKKMDLRKEYGLPEENVKTSSEPSKKNNGDDIDDEK